MKKLPSSVLSLICKRLKLSELVNISFICKEWNESFQNQRLWEYLYHHHYKSKPKNIVNWKNLFINKYKSKKNFESGNSTVSRLKVYSSKIRHLDLNDKYIFSYATDLKLNVISLQTGKLLSSFESESELTNMLISGNKIFAVSQHDLQILLFDEEKKEIVSESKQTKIPGFHFLSGGYLIIVSTSMKVTLIEISTMEKKEIKFDNYSVFEIKDSWLHKNILHIIFQEDQIILFRYNLIEKRILPNSNLNSGLLMGMGNKVYYTIGPDIFCYLIKYNKSENIFRLDLQTDRLNTFNLDSEVVVAGTYYGNVHIWYNFIQSKTKKKNNDRIKT